MITVAEATQALNTARASLTAAEDAFGADASERKWKEVLAAREHADRCRVVLAGAERRAEEDAKRAEEERIAALRAELAGIEAAIPTGLEAKHVEAILAAEEALYQTIMQAHAEIDARDVQYQRADQIRAELRAGATTREPTSISAIERIVRASMWDQSRTPARNTHARRHEGRELFLLASDWIRPDINLRNLSRRIPDAALSAARVLRVAPEEASPEVLAAD